MLQKMNLFLAARAIKSRTLALHNLFDRCVTDPARLTRTAIHHIALLKVTGLAIAVGKIAQGAAALCD